MRVPGVRKALRQLGPKVRSDVLARMRALATDPRPAGAEARQIAPKALAPLEFHSLSFHNPFHATIGGS
jgi:hypothetical protein